MCYPPTKEFDLRDYADGVTMDFIYKYIVEILDVIFAETANLRNAQVSEEEIGRFMTQIQKAKEAISKRRNEAYEQMNQALIMVETAKAYEKSVENTFDGIKNSSQILRLLQCLALQIGSEVSFNELATHLEISANTVKKYVELLEKCYVIFTLPAFSRNMRNEIAGNRTRKIYFYDIGIRNALLNSYQPINMRPDAGGIWENFCIVELKKKAQRKERLSKFYFWRTYQAEEIDLIEEEDGEYTAYEFKVSPNKKAKLPKGFAENYNVKSFNVINKENWYKYF